jgi:hypothetical protein
MSKNTSPEMPESVAVVNVKNVAENIMGFEPRRRGELGHKAYLVTTPAQLLRLYRLAKKATDNPPNGTALIQNVRLFIFDGSDSEPRIQICSSDFFNPNHII